MILIKRKYFVFTQVIYWCMKGGNFLFVADLFKFFYGSEQSRYHDDRDHYVISTYINVMCLLRAYLL